MTTSPFSANLTELYYKVEKQVGINQPHAFWNRLRLRSETLSQSKTQVGSRKFSHRGNLTSVSFTDDAITGNITCLLTPTDIDEMFQSVMRNRWNARQLHQGEVNRTYSLLLVNTDNSGNKKYTMFLGCVFTNCSFNFQINSYVTFQFNVAGLKVVNNYQPDSNISFQQATDNNGFIGRDGIISRNGDAVGLISAFTGSFGHNVDVLKTINFEQPFKLNYRAFEADCELSAAFANSTNILDYINETNFELQIRLEYQDDRYSFIFPKCLLTNISFPSSGQGAIVINSQVLPLFSTNRGSTVILKKERITQ